jgi:hypothetical protein
MTSTPIIGFPSISFAIPFMVIDWAVIKNDNIMNIEVNEYLIVLLLASDVKSLKNLMEYAFNFYSAKANLFYLLPIK